MLADECDARGVNRHSITFLGVMLNKLGVDAELGKMLIYSVIFGVYDSVKPVVAALSHKAIWKKYLPGSPNIRQLLNFKKELSKTSDFICTSKAYKIWQRHGESVNASKEFHLNHDNMVMVKRLCNDFDERMKFLKLLGPAATRNEKLPDSYKEIVMTGAILPKLITPKRTLLTDKKAKIDIAEESIACRAPKNVGLVWAFQDMIRLENSKKWIAFEVNRANWSSVVFFNKYCRPTLAPFNEDIIQMYQNESNSVFFNKHSGKEAIDDCDFLKGRFDNVLRIRYFFTSKV